MPVLQSSQFLVLLYFEFFIELFYIFFDFFLSVPDHLSSHQNEGPSDVLSSDFLYDSHHIPQPFLFHNNSS